MRVTLLFRITIAFAITTPAPSSYLLSHGLIKGFSMLLLLASFLAGVAMGVLVTYFGEFLRSRGYRPFR